MAKVTMILAVFLVGLGARVGAGVAYDLDDLKEALVGLGARVGAGVAYHLDDLKEALAHVIEPDPCRKDLIAYYKFDVSFRDVCFGNNAVRKGKYPLLSELSGISKGALMFDSSQQNTVHVPSLNGFEWGSTFSVSLWFKSTNYWGSPNVGLINNGAVYKDVVVLNANRSEIVGSWEILIKPGETEDTICAALVTSHSVKVWYNTTTAFRGAWHHLVMTYNGKAVRFYLDNRLKYTDLECCYGDIVVKNTDLVIGQTKNEGYYDVGQFLGYIDEVKLFKKALSAHQVTRLYQLKNV